MSKLFQITEEDLATLEADVPAVCAMFMQHLDSNAARTKIRRLQAILTNVRWNYGPWSDVTVIPTDGDQTT